MRKLLTDDVEDIPKNNELRSATIKILTKHY